MICAASPTLLAYLDHYAALRPGLRPASLAQYRIAVRRLDAWAGRQVRLAELCPELMGRWLRSMASGCAVTANSKARQVKTLWRAAADEGHCEPPRRLARLPETERVPKAWTIEEVNRLVAACRNARPDYWPNGQRPALWWPAIVVTVYWTGARVGAVLAARTSECDLTQGVLALVEPKTRKARLHRLPAKCVQALQPLYDPARELLFPWPYTRRVLWRQFRRLVEAAGLPAAKGNHNLFHKLRRTHASYAAARGGLALAAASLGHSSAALTLKHYVDPRIYRQPSAADVLPVLDF